MIKPPRLICTDQAIVYMDILPMKPKQITVIRYNEIITFEKRKWYSLLGTITITGEAQNIREGQQTKLFIEMKNMWFYHWRVFFISTGIRRRIIKNR